MLAYAYNVCMGLLYCFFTVCLFKKKTIMSSVVTFDTKYSNPNLVNRILLSKSVINFPMNVVNVSVRCKCYFCGR